jgi:hypothetical protein
MLSPAERIAVVLHDLVEVHGARPGRPPPTFAALLKQVEVALIDGGVGIVQAAGGRRPVANWRVC